MKECNRLRRWCFCQVNRMITGVVMEREARLREGMRMMGMRSSAFYASWVVTYVPGQNDFDSESFLKDNTFVWERYSEVLLYLFVVTGVVLLLSVGQILPRSSPSLLFVWLMRLGNSKCAFFLCR